MIKELNTKKKLISVVGLGYVGLPLALELAKKYKVIGMDINPERVALMKNGIDPSNELESSAFDNTDILFTSDASDLKKAHFHIVAVPTPVDEYKIPNLKPVIGATKTVASALKKGDFVVFESTVYPGCTEEDCLPILEEISGLKLGDDFKLGYSPERINPGDKVHTLTKILKIVSGSDDEGLEVISNVYGSIIEAGIYKAESIRVAEAAKIIENTQRDINISLMNELSIIFDKMNINTKAVLEAAGTKWNFLRFSPGLVGGHCIGVDPYYLLHKSKEIGYDPQVILSGRRVNDQMPGYIAKKVTKLLIQNGKNPNESKVLVKGITFKENVSDIRNSKVVDLILALNDYSIKTDLVDPLASADEVKHEYNLELSGHPDSGYDAVILAVNHEHYKDLSPKDFQDMMTRNPILVDIKGMFRADEMKSKGITYWSL